MNMQSAFCDKLLQKMSNKISMEIICNLMNENQGGRRNELFY